MVTALATDLVGLEGVSICLLWDSRLKVPAALEHPRIERVTVRAPSQYREQLEMRFRQADGSIVIAPELDSVLLRICRLAEHRQANLLSPSAQFVELTSDKTATVEWLAHAGVPVPPGRLWRGPGDRADDLPFPVVLKRNDGAGSWQMQRYDRPPALAACRPPAGQQPGPLMRVETLRRGLAASIAWLCGPGGQRILPACGQRLSGDGRFGYLGGWIIGEAELQRRAVRLAQRTLAALPPACGYVGVDLVLGRSPDGGDDCVIEVNPRLTSSYIGLRRACRGNLAGAWLQLAAGNRPDLDEFGAEQLHFAPADLASE